MKDENLQFSEYPLSYARPSTKIETTLQNLKIDRFCLQIFQRVLLKYTLALRPPFIAVLQPEKREKKPLCRTKGCTLGYIQSKSANIQIIERHVDDHPLISFKFQRMVTKVSLYEVYARCDKIHKYTTFRGKHIGFKQCIYLLPCPLQTHQ